MKIEILKEKNLKGNLMQRVLFRFLAAFFKVNTVLDWYMDKRMEAITNTPKRHFLSNSTSSIAT